MNINDQRERFQKNCSRFNLGSDCDFDKIFYEYYRPHRFFHNFQHVVDIWDDIDELARDKYCIPYEVGFLYVIALFHDVVYFPNSKTNEEDSVKYFLNVMSKTSNPYFTKDDLDLVSQVIMGTKDHKTVYHPIRQDGMNYKLSAKFNIMDMKSLYDFDFMKTEMAIFKEFQNVSLSEWREGRLKFLEPLMMDEENPEEHNKIIKCRKTFVKNFTPNIGIFAGTFNNFHIGHLNVLEKAEKIFDKVIVLCAFNPAKNNDREAIFSQVKSVLPFHEVVLWEGLLTEYVNIVKSQGARVSIVKGVRDDHDLNAELTQYKFMQDICKDVSVLYIPCDREFEHVSSSALKQLEKFNVNTNKYTPTKYDYFKKVKENEKC